jgi:hypothetical protein
MNNNNTQSFPISGAALGGDVIYLMESGNVAALDGVIEFNPSDVTNADDIITIANHGLGTATKLLYTAGGTKVTGLSTGTSYYVIVVDSNTIQLASSVNNALAGTAITLSGTSVGVQKLTHEGDGDLAIGINLHDVSQKESGRPSGVQLFNHGSLYAKCVGYIKVGSTIGTADDSSALAIVAASSEKRVGLATTGVKIPAYSATQTYYTGDLVSTATVIYQSTAGNAPKVFNAGDWTNVTASFISYQHIISR